MKPSNRITIDIYDNGGKTIDRYAIAITGLQKSPNPLWKHEIVEYTVWLHASETPFHPQSIGMHGSEELTQLYSVHNHRNLGKWVGFYDVPKDVQRFIAQELLPD